MHKNSIRHLAVSNTGAVAFGMQGQGVTSPDALIGLHRLTGAIELLEAPSEDIRHMDGYIGSIAFAQNGKAIAATSPRGGRVQVFDAERRSLTYSSAITDACGVAANRGSFIATSGTGVIETLQQRVGLGTVRVPLMFDNHLVALSL